MEKKPRNRNKLSMMLIGLGAGVILGAGALLLIANPDLRSIESLWNEAKSAYAAARGVEVNQLAPDMVLQNLDGQLVRLEDLRGRVVVLNFWATWCGPCRVEMPIFQDYHVRYSPELAILGVDFQESKEVVQEFIDQYGLTYEILLDPKGEASSLYQVTMLPNTFIIDGQGSIRFHHVGTLSQEQFTAYLAQVGIGENK